MTIQDDLQKFYNAEAKKYAETREKHRSEADIFLDIIQQDEKKSIKVLELGCGSGRLLKHLGKIKNKRIDYIGIDLSPELLKIAKKQVKPSNTKIKTSFVCGDMLEVLTGYKQESFDYIIAISSFQHIPSKKERFYLMKNFYRLLMYEGTLIMTNWSFSSRFIKKYQDVLIKAFFWYAISWGKKQRNDLLIPWIAQRRTFWRFYHIFTRKELTALLVLSGFTVKKITYLDIKGKETTDRKISKSTLTIGQKNVWHTS